MSLETAKQRARTLLEALPNSANWPDILYALELEADIEHGIRDAKSGRIADSRALSREFGLERRGRT